MSHSLPDPFKTHPLQAKRHWCGAKMRDRLQLEVGDDGEGDFKKNWTALHGEIGMVAVRPESGRLGCLPCMNASITLRSSSCA